MVWLRTKSTYLGLKHGQAENEIHVFRIETHGLAENEIHVFRIETHGLVENEIHVFRTETWSG